MAQISYWYKGRRKQPDFWFLNFFVQKKILEEALNIEILTMFIFLVLLEPGKANPPVFVETLF